MPKHALLKYLSDGELAEVVNPTGRQYRLEHGKVRGVAIAAAIEPTKLCPKLKGKMQFDVETHDLGALVSIIAKQQRVQVVTEDKHAACRQTAKRREA